MPGDVAQTGSVKLLGLLNVTQLLSVMDVAYPRISDSGIEGNDLKVTASGKNGDVALSLIHISEPTRPELVSRMPSSA